MTGSTHGACGQSWTGLRACHCAGCHQTFSGPYLFDGHRAPRGEHGVCLDPAELPGFEFRDGMWHAPGMTDADKLAAFGRS